MWIFVVLLLNAGSQFSPMYKTHSDCESARLEVAATQQFNGRAVDRTFDCVRVK